jgi:hypothetical protein
MEIHYVKNMQSRRTQISPDSSGFPDFFAGCLCAKREEEYGNFDDASLSWGITGLEFTVQSCQHYLLTYPGLLASLSSISALSEKRNTAIFIMLAYSRALSKVS